ncbi:MAG: metallophosphoesterase [Clostridia bacterium]|nr:metallophosphoesterase [Clostridia bacterium]
MGKISPLFGGAKLVCVITSDNHIDVKHPVPKVPMWFLTQSLKDSAKAAVPVDAYITVGDTTSRGSIENWELVRKCFRGVRPAENIFLTVGNHDLWHDGGFDAALNNYLLYSNKICGTNHDKTWFSHTVNGYKLIFLGNTEDAGCEAHLGEAQLAWLDAELTETGGKPAFVFCHQSLNGRHGLPVTWDRSGTCTDPMEGGVGTESDELAEILKKYPKVFYFSGHSHMGLGGEKRMAEDGYSSFEKEGSLTLINLPSLACGNHHGDDRSMGIGLVLEVYDDRVLIRPRNFATHTMNSRVLIKDGKPYWEELLDA